MKNSQNRPMRVLLIDDRPEYFYSEKLSDVIAPYNALDDFHISWVQNPLDAKWLMAFIERFQNSNPSSLEQFGMPFDIIIFDYDLSLPNKYIRSESNESHIVARTQHYLRHNGLDHNLISNSEQPTFDSLNNKDRSGCYIGVTLARIFRDYPCAAIPTTTHIDTEGTDAKIFEWLNEEYLQNAFEFKRGAPNKQGLLKRGTHNLRFRLVQLLREGTIIISIESLRILGESASPESETLAFHTKYGVTRYSIKTLFYDSSDEADLRSKLELFTQSIHESLFKNSSISAYHEAKKIAQDYYALGHSELATQRERLSFFASKTEISNTEEQELKKLCQEFQIDYNDLRQKPKEVRISNLHSVPIWRSSTKSDLVARWALLMIVILCEKDSAFSYEAVLEGESLPRTTTIDYILQYLDPSPESLFCCMHSSTAKEKIKKNIDRLGHRKSTRGPLSLDLQSLINSPESALESQNLRNGEAPILKAFAKDIGLSSTRWPKWLQNAL